MCVLHCIDAQLLLLLAKHRFGSHFSIHYSQLFVLNVQFKLVDAVDGFHQQSSLSYESHLVDLLQT